ncbi:MAG TPA: hypothetical protein VHB02_06150 [Acidimicrobiales bacterium]|nr:hypothetical protein [Acidimicrobiales bacterium]
MMTFDGLSRQKDKALAKIATGTPLPRCHPATLQSLERKGLIVRVQDKVVGHDAFGVVALPQYEMPIHHHIRWCAWAAEQEGITS